MTVNERGDESAVYVAWNRDVVGVRMTYGDGFLAVPERLDLQAMRIQAATAVTMAEVIWVIVL